MQNEELNLEKYEQMYYDAETNRLYYDSIQIQKILEDNVTYYFSTEKPLVRKKLDEFVDGFDKDWIRERRLEYLETALKEAFAEKERYEAAEKKLGIFFIYEKELKKVRDLYKRLYIGYATLYGNKEKENWKFSDDVIERCRQVPIRELIDQQVMNAGNGRERVLCPFHNEKTGSFFIFPDHSWHCFGCAESGNNAIDFIIKKRDCSFYEAVDYLKHF